MNTKILNKENTAMLLGHLWYDFSMRETLISRIDAAIQRAYNNGIRNFLSGFSVGTDSLMAQRIALYKQSHKDVRLFRVVPFDGFKEVKNAFDRKIFNSLERVSDGTLILSDKFYSLCFMDRLEFMICNSSFLITFYDGVTQGLMSDALKKAVKMKLTIDNIY